MEMEARVGGPLKRGLKARTEAASDREQIDAAAERGEVRLLNREELDRLMEDRGEYDRNLR
jgi:hypothetical protein